MLIVIYPLPLCKFLYLSKQKESLLKPKQCPRCSVINARDARFCHKCTSILDVDTAINLDEQRRDGDELLAKLMKDAEVQRLLTRKIIDMGLQDELLGVRKSQKNP